MTMANFLLCGCGHQADTANKRPGETVECPGCGSHMPIPGDSTDDFVRQLMAEPNRPGIFAHVQLDKAEPQGSQDGWFRRLLKRLRLG
jgi:hypothetical protein